MKQHFQGKVIIVTGGTGSIGSEIVRQLLRYNPKVIRIVSRDETKQVVLRETLGNPDNVRFLIGDIRNRVRLNRAFEGADIVFHAAAMKHVPVCEYNPFEAVQTNVQGTQNVIEAAIDHKVKKVIAISTDKAITPTNTMGATKLLSEKLLAVANWWAKDTLFGSVRFGNVLCSRGSFIPIVEEQVREGRPVTLTDPGMTRFMMSIPQAVSLVLKAATTLSGVGGDCFILRMPSMRIADLLDVLIERFSKKYDKDPATIKTKIIGMREGEKLHEELITEEELTRLKVMPKMLRVLPISNKGRKQAKRVAINPGEYDSSKAKALSKTQIRALLDNAGIA